MNIATPEFQESVQKLIDNLPRTDCIDDEEYRLAQEFQALPLGFGLWGYCFLRPDGERIWTDWEGNEDIRTQTLQGLICSIVDAAKRYPQLSVFIPMKPPEAITCPACQGTKLWGRIVGTNKPGRCIFCAELGWVLPE